MIVLGIDPGLRGGLAAWSDGTVVAMAKMPIRQKIMDWGAIRAWLDALPAPCAAYIETPQMRPGSQGHLTAAGNWGGLKVLLFLAGMRTIHVPANAWCRALGKPPGSGKTWNMALASQLAGTEISHDGIADALLIGHYGQGCEDR